MAKDEVRAEKKEKKDKKRKAAEAVDDAADGTPVKKEKKDKKKRKTAEADDDSMMDVDGGNSLVKVQTEDGKDEKAIVAVPVEALVPFANPLADEKSQKKVLKAVKKGMSSISHHSNLSFVLMSFALRSQIQIPQARRERMRQIDPQIARRDTRFSLRQHPPQWHCHSRRRYLAHGRHQSYSRAV